MVFGIYAVLLAIVSWHHQMDKDELQAWLIARDSNSLINLFHNLRYEGHPMLWHLILFIPSHLSWNPVSMQIINYLFALITAWMFIGFRKMDWRIRALILFSFFVLYDFGAVARNYMLALMLLTAAVRCLLAEKPRRRWAVVFLALAVQSHFFALPLVLVIFIWGFVARRLNATTVLKDVLSKGESWVAAIILLASTVFTYFTVRPPADIKVPHYGVEQHSFAYYFLLTEGKAWQAFLTLPASGLPSRLSTLIVPVRHVAPLGCLLTLLVFAVMLLALRTLQARWFFGSSAAILLAVMAETVHAGNIRYYGMVFSTYLLALLIDAAVFQHGKQRKFLPQNSAMVVILCLLGLQAAVALFTIWTGFSRPFSQGKDASLWLKEHKLDAGPLIIEPDHWGATMLGYLERQNAYYPSCKCMGSFAVWNSKREVDAEVSDSVLADMVQNSPLPVILISHAELSPERVKRQQLTRFPSAKLSL